MRSMNKGSWVYLPTLITLSMLQEQKDRHYTFHPEVFFEDLNPGWTEQVLGFMAKNPTCSMSIDARYHQDSYSDGETLRGEGMVYCQTR